MAALTTFSSVGDDSGDGDVGDVDADGVPEPCSRDAAIARVAQSPLCMGLLLTDRVLHGPGVVSSAAGEGCSEVGRRRIVAAASDAAERKIVFVGPSGSSNAYVADSLVSLPLSPLLRPSPAAWAHAAQAASKSALNLRQSSSTHLRGALLRSGGVFCGELRRSGRLRNGGGGAVWRG